MLRLLHTSDWHLGHWLHDLSREHEHGRFLAWLLDTIEREQVDALLIAGDVFEQASPPVPAMAMWFEFLANARRRFPSLDVVVIGGNHDSPARLDAPNPVLRPLGVHIVGAMRDGPDDLIVPVRDRDGRIGAWVAAVPFLRPSDLPRPQQPTDDPLIEGVRAVYADVLGALRERREAEQAIVAMGHCYMVGTELSYMSERRILGGNQHALPVNIFPDDVAYAALGHLHQPQRVGKREHVRYCGAPVPLAMNEARYRSQVVIVDLDGERAVDIRPVDIPRSVELLRVPAVRPAPLSEVLPQLTALAERDPTVPDDQRPFLEVRVALPQPEPSLRRDIEAALEGKAARLVRVEVQYTGDARALSDSVPGASLEDLQPRDVFLRRYARDHSTAPSAPLVDAFEQLLDQVHQERRG